MSEIDMTAAKGRVEIRAATSQYQQAMGSHLGGARNRLGYAVALSADGSTVLVGAPGSRQVYWAGSAFLTGGNGASALSEVSAIGNRLAVSKDGSFWASWRREPTSIEVIVYRKVDEEYQTYSAGEFRDANKPLAISGNGQYLAVVSETDSVSGEDLIDVYRIEPQRFSEQTQVARGRATGLAFDDSGSTLVICLNDTVAMFERAPKGWTQMVMNSNVTSCQSAVAISADGRKVVVGDPSQNSVYTYVRE